MAKVTLYARIYTGDRKASWQRVEFSANHKPVAVKDAFDYSLRVGGKFISCKTTDIAAATAALKRKELELLDGTSPEPAAPKPEPNSAKHTLAVASEKYFANLDNRGTDPKTIRKYRAAIDPFVEQRKQTYVEDVTKQDVLNYMGWLRKQPTRERVSPVTGESTANPERTIANKIGDLRIFLKAFGVTKLLSKNEEPKFHEKKIIAHTDEELGVLYGEADAEETFLLDFFIGSMVRDFEGYNARYRDLKGTTLTVYGKQHKTRTVEISPRLADAIEQRRIRLGKKPGDLLFVNAAGNPDQHLLRKLQALAKRAGATFHTELHSLRKTGASRRYINDVPLMTLMLELGHESLSVTQKYLSDVKKEATKKAVAAADFVPRPRIVRTGTSGD